MFVTTHAAGYDVLGRRVLYSSGFRSSPGEREKAGISVRDAPRGYLQAYQGLIHGYACGRTGYDNLNKS